MINVLATLMVLAGVVLHGVALSLLRRLTRILSDSSSRRHWLVLSGLIGIFIVGYLGYLAVLWNQHGRWYDLLIPSIFLLGAVFVWLTIRLSLDTAIDLRRVVRLEAQSITDPLTRIYNRRYLEQRLDKEVARSKRHQFALSVLMIDVDHFKQINDKYGHQAGDTVLVTLAEQLKHALREMDVVVRYGGEEFVVVCPDTSLPSARVAAERIRMLVESLRITITDGKGTSQILQITVSIGVAEFSATTNAAAILRSADEAMYRAKQQGRNRTIT